MGVPPGVPHDVPHVVSFEAMDGGRTKMTVTEYGYTTERARDVSKAWSSASTRRPRSSPGPSCVVAVATHAQTLEGRNE
jgi:hypothetical protein